MSAPVSDYMVMAKLRPNRQYLYAPGRRDWSSIIPPPPPPAGGVVVMPYMFGTALYTPVAPPNARDTLTYGVDMPTRQTTGVTNKNILVETPATTYSGTGTAAAPIIVQDKWFTGRVTVTGQWYEFRNCWFSGEPIAVGALVLCSSATSANNKFVDCTFWPQNPQWDTPAIKGYQLTLERCYIRGCTDGIAHVGRGTNYTGTDQNVNSYGSLYELMCYVSPDQGASGGLPDNASHLDVCAQLRGGNNFVFKGNLVQAYLDPTIGQGGQLPVYLSSGTHVTGNTNATATDPSYQAMSAFMLSPVLGQFDGLRIEQNWMNGGAVLVNFAGHTTAGTALGGIQVLGNRVGLDHRVGPNFWWLAKTVLPISISGNTVYTFPAGGQVTWNADGSVLAGGTTTTTTANTRSAG